jgi:2-(1,2-epoxy-1,2-dihydrophenyl)acetyl-CoA isomerase
LTSELWDFLKEETGDPKPILVVLAPPDLLGRANLERLLCGQNSNESLSASEIGVRIIRQENVIQRFIKGARQLDSFVIGVVGGELALPLAAPLLACDYRIVGSDTTFVNTTQALPRAPLGGLPWLLSDLVGGAKATQLMLDVPRLSAEDAHTLGLVNHVTEPDRLDEDAFEIADRLGSLPRATLMSLKRSMIASSDDLSSYLRQELALTEQLASPRWGDGEWNTSSQRLKTSER